MHEENYLEVKTNGTLTLDKIDYSSKSHAFIQDSACANTRRAQIGDMRYFMEWFQYAVEIPKETSVINEETVLKFIFHHLEGMPDNIEKILVLRGLKKPGCHSYNTVCRRISSLSVFLERANLPDPTKYKLVKRLMASMLKTCTTPKRSNAITKNILEDIIITCNGDSAIDKRDTALIMFGWASGGRRRSEIANAQFKDLHETEDGDYIYHIPKSKTDQAGQGIDVPIKARAAKALRAWLKFIPVKEGYIFRSVLKGAKLGDRITCQDINRIIKKRISMAGYDPEKYSAHGIRRGFVTEAGKQGHPIGDVMAMTGHRSVTTAMKYYESGAIINNKAANML